MVKPANDQPGISERVATLAARVAELQAALDRSESARAGAEADLRATEQRYLLALRGSQDGLWEWDIASGAVHLSPRWKSMLGFDANEVTDDRAGWIGRIHPDDRDGFDAVLRHHLDGASDAVDHELRLVHKDGRTRHILSRAVAIRRASGAPYRVVGLDTDITRVRQVGALLDALAEGTAGKWGQALFAAMVEQFGRATGVDRVFITECADDDAAPGARPSRVRALADWTAGNGAGPAFEYSLSGTPCEEVIEQGRACFHPHGLAARFPREAGWEGYLGLPIVGSDSQVLGHLAFLSRGTMQIDEAMIERVAQVFLARAAAEMERLRLGGR